MFAVGVVVEFVVVFSVLFVCFVGVARGVEFVPAIGV